MSDMRKFLTIVIAILGLAVCAAAKDKAVCTVRPEECHKQIKPLTQSEVSELKKVRAQYDDAERQLELLGDAVNRVLDKALKAHGIPENAISVDRKWGTKGSTLGGTCMGKVEISGDFLLYTPPDDIQSCYIEVQP